MQKSDSVVIIPTYNEKENIENIIRTVFSLEHRFDILIIDDGSPDGTANIVKNLMAVEFKDRLHLVERQGKLGLGTAYIAGFKWALEHGYEYIFEMDADFSHDPNDVPRLYKANGPCINELLRLKICAYCYRHPRTRHHRRLQMLPPSRTGDDRLGCHPFQGLRFSD